MTTATQAVGQLRTKYKVLGIKPPAALFADLSDLDDKLRTSLRHDSADLANAVADALVAGKDPATDRTVLEQLARRQLAESNISQRMTVVREDRQLAILRRHAAGIIEDLAKVVAAADTILDKARRQIPHLNLANLDGLRPDQMSAWGEAREAAVKVDSAVDVCVALLTATEQVQNIPHGDKPLIYTDISHRDLTALAHSDAPLRTTEVIEAGHRLSLADAQTFKARRQRIVRERKEAAAQTEADRSHAIREAIRAGG